MGHQIETGGEPVTDFGYLVNTYDYSGGPNQSPSQKTKNYDVNCDFEHTTPHEESTYTCNDHFLHIAGSNIYI